MSIRRLTWDVIDDNVIVDINAATGEREVLSNEAGLFGSPFSFSKIGVVAGCFHFDGQGSTRKITQTDEGVGYEACYSAFGEIISQTPSSEVRFGYFGSDGFQSTQGNERIYVRNRSYDAVIGRWLSVDPLGPLDHSNLYRAGFVPDGHDPTGLLVNIRDTNRQGEILRLFNELCPEASGFTLNDLHYLESPDGFCESLQAEESTAPSTSCVTPPNTRSMSVAKTRMSNDVTNKTACKCICDAINETELIRVEGNEQRARRGGGGVTRGNHIFIGEGKGNPVDGVGDAKPPGGDKSKLRNPLWIVLGHELCGHALPNVQLNARERDARDQLEAVLIENRIRKERSDDWGQRSGFDHPGSREIK